MTVSVTEDGAIALEGNCSADDAETLLRHLLMNPSAEVDWCACDHLHTSVVQVLMATQPAMRGAPRSNFLVRWIQPILSRNAI